MPDKKLTDSEIVKALEYCNGTDSCYECEYFKQYCKGDMNVPLKDALDLINRLQAEIEKLAKVDYFQWEKDLKTIAVKEFWNELKKHAYTRTGQFVMVEDGNNLLKELVGGNE